MSQANPAPRSRRLNRRALIILASIVVSCLVALFGWQQYRNLGGRKNLLREAQERKAKGQSALALAYVSRYLDKSPEDVEGLELKATILADEARNAAQFVEASKALGQVVARLPAKDPRRKDLYRRMAKLSISAGPGHGRTAENQVLEVFEKDAQGKPVKKDGLYVGDPEALRIYAQANVRIAVDEGRTNLLEVARQYYEAAEAREPGDVRGAQLLAELFRTRLDDPAKAIQSLDKVVAATAKVPEKHAEALLARARYLVEYESIEKAEADVLESIRLRPHDVPTLILAADIANKRGNPVAARHFLASIPADQQQGVEVKLMMGMIELTEQHPDQAIQSWRAGLVHASGSDKALTWSLAYTLLRPELNRAKEARPLIEQFRRLEESEAPSARYRFLMGLYYLQTKQYQSAIGEFEAIRYKLEGNDRRLEPLVYLWLGKAYDGHNDRPKALDALNHAAEISTTSSEPWVYLAYLQSSPDKSKIGSKGDLPAALATVDRGLAIMPNDPELLTMAARLRYQEQLRTPKDRRNLAPLEAALAKARERSPGSTEVALLEADYYYSTLEQPEEAIAILKAGLGLHPKAADLWLALMNAESKQGRFAEALATNERAIAAAGPIPAFYVNRASLLVMRGERSQAKKALTDGLSKVPAENRWVLWKSLGDYYKALKDITNARAAYEEWAALRPADPEPLYALFELSLADGDDAAVERCISRMEAVCEKTAFQPLYARVQLLLRTRSNEKEADIDPARLDKARALAMEIRKATPKEVAGYMATGQVADRRVVSLDARIIAAEKAGDAKAVAKLKAERKTDLDEAITSYKTAMTMESGGLAQRPLIAILVREKRGEDLEQLRQAIQGGPGEFERLAGMMAMAGGDKGMAEQLAEQAVRGNPEVMDPKIWQAQVLKSLGKTKEAEAALRVLIAASPNEPAPWLQLFMLQVGQNDMKGAAQTVEEIKARPIKAKYPELFWAQCYRVLGDFRKADATYRAALARWPGDPEVLGMAATFYEQLGRRDEAEAALRAILARDKNNAGAARKLAQVLASKAGNRAAFDEALAIVGPDPKPNDVTDDLLARATVYSQGPETSQRRKAVEILKGVVSEMPELNALHEQLGRLYFALHDVPNARAEAAKAATGDKATLDAILFYAAMLMASDDVSAAEDQLNRLVVLSPDSLPVVELKARIAAAKGKPEEGAKAVEKAYLDRADSPEGGAIGEKMIEILNTIEQPDAAERIARKLATKSQRGRCVLAEFLAAHGKPDEAAKELEEAAKQGDPSAPGVIALNLATRPKADPRWLALAEKLLTPKPAGAAGSNVDRLQRLALLWHLQHKHEEEIQAYRDLLAAKPSNYLFLNNMAWTLSEEMDRPKEALEWADKAVKLAGASPSVLDTRGVILTRLERYDEAIKDLEAAAVDTTDGSIYYHLARAYKKKGADELWRKSRDLARARGLAREQLQPSEQPGWAAVMEP